MSCTVLSTRWARVPVCMVLAAFLTACSGGGSGGDPAPAPVTGAPAPFTLQGTIVDGPVVDASVRVLDADGNQVANTTADSNARYSVSVPASARMPLRVEASGGNDLVTGGPLDFTLLGSVTNSGTQTLNLSPLGSLASEAASCAGDLTGGSLQAAWENVAEKLSMGLDTSVMGNMLSDAVNADNIATVVLSNEALGETFRRTANALAAAGEPADMNSVLQQMACDLADGEIDGNGSNVDPRTAATFRAAEVAVSLETIAGRLEVNGQDVTSLMDQSIGEVMVDAVGRSVSSVDVAPALAAQVIEAVSSLRGSGISGDDTLTEVADLLARNEGGDLKRQIDAFLTPARQSDVAAVKDGVALADPSAVARLAERMEARTTASRPFLSLSVSSDLVETGASVSLSWASSGAESCRASGGWSGTKELEGAQTIASVDDSSRFVLTCIGLGGAVSRSVVVNVEGQAPVRSAPEPAPAPAPAPEEPSTPESGNTGEAGGETPSTTTPEPSAPAPAPAPTPEPEPEDPSSALPPVASLSASSRSVASGDDVTLRWSSREADSCQASGAWSGALSASGSRTIGPLTANSTFRVTCSGEGGRAVAIVSVNVLSSGGFNLSWAPPEENADGTLVTRLGGYRIYYGDTPGDYPNVEEIVDPLITSHTVAATPGTYYVVMTALDPNGEESGYSNEVRTVAQ